MRTSNPALNDKAFQGFPIGATSDQVMTLQGTINKSAIAIVLTMAAGYWAFGQVETMMSLYLPFIIGGLVLALIITFKKTTAPVLVPVYAVVEGLALGAISAYFEQFYPGIAFQAVSLTFGTLIALLMAYKAGLVKATQKFRTGVMAATGAIFIVYGINLVMSFFGSSIPFIHSSGMFGIGISIAIVAVAALNLILDFDFIEKASARGNAPKYMEWYGAFGLLVTLVWLYFEILRLLAKLQSRD